MLDGLFKFVDDVANETSKIANNIVNDTANIINNAATETSKIANDILNETGNALNNTANMTVNIANNAINETTSFVNKVGTVADHLLRLPSRYRQERLEKIQDEKFREAQSVHFPDFLTQENFNKIIHEEVGQIKRIKEIEINQALVNFEVYSNSRISTWMFTLDYNDYGNLSGKVRIYKENYDSDIPTNISNRISKRINDVLKNYYIPVPDDYESLISKDLNELEELFKDSGFNNVVLVSKKYKQLPALVFNYNIHSVTISNCKYFDKDSYFDSNSSVVISYYLQED